MLMRRNGAIGGAGVESVSSERERRRARVAELRSREAERRQHHDALWRQFRMKMLVVAVLLEILAVCIIASQGGRV